MRRSIVLSILLALLANRATAGEVLVTPFVGGYSFDDAERLTTRPEYGLRAGYGITERWVVEGVADWLTTRNGNGNTRVNAWKYRGEILYRFFPNERLVPFAAAGGGATTMSGAGRDAALVDYGGGFIYGMSDRLGLRGDVRHVILPERGRNNIEYTLGLALLLGEKRPASWRQRASMPPATDDDRERAAGDKIPQRPPTVGHGEPGPADRESPAPGTTKGTTPGTPEAPPERLAQQPPVTTEQLQPSPQRPPTVWHGEPGHPDREGPEPGTTKGPTRGTPDAPPERLAQLPPATTERPQPSPPLRQQSPGTDVPPTGEKGQEPPPSVASGGPAAPGDRPGVQTPPQQSGKPGDSDHDGVPDSEDRCPGSPGVDRYGCPKDSDHDGVPDLCDRCPDTPPGVAVERDGCPPPKKVCITLNVRFAFDSSAVAPAYHDDIARVAAFLKKYPTATAVIEGHTDSTGPESYNHWLSYRRADSVMNYLVERLGVEPHRLAARGYGETRPVTTNATPEGRQQNRRIDAVIDCGLEPSTTVPPR